jgi:tyrosine-protein phosphatase SIW14
LRSLWSQVRGKDVRSWLFGLAIAAFITVVPIVYYRMTYSETKRLRVVTAEKLYRSGCMTAWGLEMAIRTHKIRTVINLMEEDPDPELPRSYFGGEREKESELCRRLGAQYRNLYVDLVALHRLDRERPPTIDQYLEILDDPKNYPVLLHCKAGLHRTGVLVGVYRMEYEGWSRAQALAEVRRNGFGTFTSTAANQYINQYILRYEPHRRPGRVGNVVERLPASREVPGSLTSRPTLLPGAYEPLPKE